jgi:pimeloyl-ACP methyl ester carboxylesterase
MTTAAGPARGGAAAGRIPAFANDDLTFTVTDTGPSDGAPVVMLHGFPQRASCWHGVGAELNELGYRTLAPDQRGYSPLARPRTRTAYRSAALVSDIAALVRQVGRPVHLVGHDWGATVAWALAAGHPGLLRSLVTVSAPHPAAFTRSLLGSDQALRSAYMLAFQLPALPEAVARLVPRGLEAALRRTGMPEEAIDRFRHEMLADGTLRSALGWYRALPLDLMGAGRGRVSVPTMHVWSDRDTSLSRAGAERSGDYVDAPFELVVLPGVSHWVPDEVPETLAHLIDRRARSAW